MQKMKNKKTLIVFASTFPRWKNDTLPPFVYELSKRLTFDFDVHVLAPSFPGAKDFEVMDKMKVHRFHYFFRKYEKLAGSGGILPTLKKNPLFYFQVPFFMLGEYFALKRLVKKINPNIIHAHWTIPQGWIASLIKKKSGVPYIVTTHGGDIFSLQGKLLTSMKKETLKNAKSITVVSNAIKKEILEKIDSNLKIEVIPMGVDSKLFNPNKRDLSIKKKFGIDGPFLLFVGRLTEKKGVKYLIEAMPEVIKEFPKAKLMIIGTGELENQLKELTISLNLEKSIIFLGAIQNKELPKYYATADIFIGPSVITKKGDREGLPVTLMEAMSSGRIIIATDLEGNRDIIQDSKNGFLIKQNNSEDIAEKILYLLKNKNLFDEIQSKSRKSIINKFDWEIIVKRYSRGLL